MHHIQISEKQVLLDGVVILDTPEGVKGYYGDSNILDRLLMALDNLGIEVDID